MTEINVEHPCPICHQNFVSHWERYPLAVCQTCYGKVSDRHLLKAVDLIIEMPVFEAVDSNQ